jgi:hypothetical protein
MTEQDANQSPIFQGKVEAIRDCRVFAKPYLDLFTSGFYDSIEIHQLVGIDI